MRWNPTQTQNDILRHYGAGKRKFCWAGGVGAGKSTGSAFLGVRHVIQRPYTTLNLIAAQSSLAARRILLPALEDAAKDFGVSLSLKQWQGSHAVTLAGRHRFIFAGAADQGSERSIAGYEFASAILDEATLTHPDFFGYLPSRMRGCPDPLMIVSYNRLGMNSWVRTDLEAKVKEGEPGWTLLESLPLENLHNLPDGYLDALEMMPAHRRRQLIDNEWTSPDGLVYPEWTNAGPPENWRLCERVVGVDYGEKGVTASIALERYQVGGGPGGVWVANKEYYHDARLMSKPQLPAERHAAEIVRRSESGPDRVPTDYYIDPTAEILRYHIRKLGRHCQNARNDLEEGISATQSHLASGKLTINAAACPNLVREIQDLAWDPRTEKPDDDFDDHATDSLRYAAIRIPLPAYARPISRAAWAKAVGAAPPPWRARIDR